MSCLAWVIVAGAAAAAVVLAMLVLRRQPGRTWPLQPHPQVRPREELRVWTPRIGFVANPSKHDADDVRTRLLAQCEQRGLPQPLWLTTTVDDPGGGQARQALDAGVDVVVAVGGDGTVRAVAKTMVGAPVPMGLVPTGTGNILARNVDVPVTDVVGALGVVIDGRDADIDVGWLRVDRWGTHDHPDTHDDELFLVIAGLGFDGSMVAATDANLKARVGWVAYFLAGFRHLHERRRQVQVTRDDGDPQTAKVRSAMVGNCGRLPGGMTLLPDALLDDGWLDVALIDTRGGLAGWAQLFGEVVLQGAGMRTVLPAKIGRIDHARARRIHLEVAGSATLQVDGDIVGDVAALTTWVAPHALILRVP
ncbi:MAG: NAD(+)/NADH kinase [Micrococcales bacterium]|nr:NAD(+)/NADH kinase [Micrococcales bacterium]MCL2666488.1 NAD(+)/NADH kinase [Micrococcales bacterium]